VAQDPTSGAFTGLKSLEPSLPASWYFDEAQYQRELNAIWYRNWVYLGRSSGWPDNGTFRTYMLGTQPILVVRDSNGALRAYYNTCRHRGSLLCSTPAGTFANKIITCPYHAWSYRLNGELARIPSSGREHYVDMEHTALYPIALTEWRGFVYVNLNNVAGAVSDHFNGNAETLQHWPLEDLVVGHRTKKKLRCNWKIFWENYNECLHCPSVHPALSQLVPIYRRGIMEERDDPNWAEHAATPEPLYKGGLRIGAATWSMDGQSLGHEFKELTAEERRIGYHYMTSLPSHYLVAHVDHVRSTRLLPLGPETTELEIEWLFPRATLADPAVDIANACAFSEQVMTEDAAVCEFNQAGLHARVHQAGMLMPEEYDVFRLHNWVKAELLRP
jgi:Rieske 2Fe-2S family protein